MFSDNFSTERQLEQQRQAIFNSIRAEHEANRLVQAQDTDTGQTRSLLHVLSRLRRIRIQISFEVEEPSPKPKTAGC